MKKLLYLIIPIFIFNTINAQTYNDGCMDLNVTATWAWNEEYEDPFFNDESSWQWSVADVANVDGSDYFGDACLQQGGFFQIGWWNHSDYNIHDFSYGAVGSAQATVPQFFNLRGRYEGDDCGGNCDHNTGGFFTCFGDQDDYIFNDLVSSSIDYRAMGPPNSANIFQRLTSWHGSADYGGEFTSEYTSPRPHTVTATNTTVCDDGSNGAITLTAQGAVYGGTYRWYKGGAFTFIGTGASITVDPIADAGGGSSIIYHVYTNNGGVNSLCYNEITIDIVNCDFHCNTLTKTVTTNIPGSTDNFNYGTLTTNTFPAGSYIVDVNVGVTFKKWGAYDDIGFQLLANASGTSCTSTSLVNTDPNNGNYLGSSASGVTVTQTFDESASAQISSNNINPSSNPLVDPIGDLDCYKWSNPNRDWTLRVDHKGSLQFQMLDYSVEVCACKPPVSALITESGTATIDICETTGGSLNLELSGSIGSIDNGGFGDEVKWFTNTCYGNYEGSGNPFTIAAPTTPGTYTYYANYYIDNEACEDPSTTQTDCKSITITVHPEPNAGFVLLGGQPDLTICENTDPGIIFLIGQSGGSIIRWETSDDGGSTWTTIANTTASYSPGVMTTVGTFFYRAVTSAVGCGIVYSTNFQLNVLAEPNAGTVAMITTGSTYCSDSIFRMSTTGYSGALQWQISDDNGLSYSDIAGQSSDDLTYLITNNTFTSVDYLFRIKASNTPCADVFSAPALPITIHPSSQGGILSANQDVCIGGTVANDLLLQNAFGDSIIWELDTDINFTSPTELLHEQVLFGVNNTLSSSLIGNVNVTTYIRAKAFYNYFCGNAYSNVVTLTAISEPSNTITANQTLCIGDTPSDLIGSTPSGGTGVYTYQWQSSPLGLNTWNDIFGETSINLDPSTYTNSTSFRRIVFSGPCDVVSNEVDIVYNPQPVYTGVSSTNLTCNGSDDGTITINTINADSFSIDNGVTYFSTGNFNNLTSGAYNVFIKYSYGCDFAYSNNPVQITEPAALGITTINTNPSCGNSNNGIINVSVTNGVGILNYSLNGGALQTSNIFNGLSAGSYTVYVEDANGCNADTTVTLSDIYTLSLDTTSVTNVSCAGQNDGQVQLTTNGGQAPFIFILNGVVSQADSLFTGLSSGFYTFEVVDANGCNATTSVTISENPPVMATLDSITNVLCNGDASGAIYVSVNGGDGSYTYAWTGAGTSAMQDIVNTVAGSYNLTVTDGAGCTASLSATISSPTVLSATLNNIQNVSCHGGIDGSIDVSVSGGTTAYTFSWSNGTSVVGTSEDLNGVGAGSYVLTITDGNACTTTVNATIAENALLTGTISVNNILCYGDEGSASVSVNGGMMPYTYLWSNFDTTTTAENLNAGMVSVIITDHSGCSLQLYDTITAPNAPLKVEAIIQNVSCFGLSDGEIIANVTGGTIPYTITWMPGGGSTATNLTAGTYTINVVDNNGCSLNKTYTVSEPSGLNNVLSVTNPACFGEETGMIAVGSSGGTTPYTYSWNTSPIQTGIVAVNLAGNTSYTLTTTDGNGCVYYDTAQVTYPEEMILTTQPTSVSCISGANGMVSVSVNGGSAPYEYQLNGLFQVDSAFDHLDIGNYIVFVEDNNNCTASTSFEITGTSAMVAELEGAGSSLNFVTDNLGIVRGETVSLNVNFINDSGNPIVGYNWTPIEIDTIRNPTFNPIDDVTVLVEVLEMINGNICSVFDTLHINVSQETLVFIPTAFSPNEEGQNNFFEMNVLGAENLDVQIFNRWGEEVFRNETQGNGPNDINDPSLTDGTNPRGAWDGKYKGEDVPTGSYAYKIIVTYFDGNTKELKGTVTIIR